MPAKISNSIKPAADAIHHAVNAVDQEHDLGLGEALKKIEKMIADGFAEFKSQAKPFAESTSEHLEDVQAYVTDKARERPLVTTGIALGVGVLVGLLMSSGRKS